MFRHCWSIDNLHSSINKNDFDPFYDFFFVWLPEHHFVLSWHFISKYSLGKWFCRWDFFYSSLSRLLLSTNWFCLLRIAISSWIARDVIHYTTSSLEEHKTPFEIVGQRQKKSSLNDDNFFRCSNNNNDKNVAVVVAERPKRIPTKLQINRRVEHICHAISFSLKAIKETKPTKCYKNGTEAHTQK